MCGIVGFTGESAALPILLSGLTKLEYRGYDSCGVAIIEDGEIKSKKVSGRIKALYDLTCGGESIKGHAGIGHTRWATHGAPKDENAHPHLSQNKKFAVVHNGIIENYMSLKDELILDGYEFKSETDTEVVVHLIEKYYTGSIKKALAKTVGRLKGSYALGVIGMAEPSKIYVAKEASPLILGVGCGENYFASDVTPLIPYTRTVIYLDDGELAEISPDSISVFDASLQIKEKKISRVNWDVKAAEKGGFPHFMLKEIYEEPASAKATISPRIKDGKIVLDEIKFEPQYLNSLDKIVVVACGSAYYAGIAGKLAIEKLCKIPVSVELASEFRYSEPIVDEKTLVLILSQSGETADTIGAMKLAKEKGCRIFAIVNVVGSTISKLADYTLYTHAGPEIAVATTKGYTTQLVSIYLLALYIANATSRISVEEYSSLLRELNTIPKKMQEVIDINSSIPALAKRLKDSTSVFYIGRNTDYATALEGALKLKEISYIHAEAYAAGELKHGTIALVEEGRPVIALASNTRLIEKTVSNIVEVKARGAFVIGVTHTDNKEIFSLSDEVIVIPKTEEVFSPSIQIIPLQMLAYYTAKERDCDIDKPKNLAKSVTVE